MADHIDTTHEAIAARYLIRKHGSWYGPNSCGYTGSAIQAGRYTLDEAMEITHPNGPDGPRDGMTFVHEDEVVDADLKAYIALAAARDALAARLARISASREVWIRRAKAAQAARDEAVVMAEWYADNTRRARLIHSEGDVGRNRLQADGGNRALAFLAKHGGA